MKIINLKDIEQNRLDQIVNRSTNALGVKKIVKSIISDVKLNKDKAVFYDVKKYIDAPNFNLLVTENELSEACNKSSPIYIKSLKQAIKNITKIHNIQLKTLGQKQIVVGKGITVRRTWRPIEKVGIYIPGGKAVYPSSLLMVTIPAIIAGCKNIIICTPPDKNGNIPTATLAAAKILGIKKIFKVGGAAAIAAMAYGTETIPGVYKIFGAGNAYVTEAKLQVFPGVAVDMPAGPSEIFIIADRFANPEYIAADLLADAEHGQDSAAILLTTSRQLAEKVLSEINKQLKSLSTAQRIKNSLQKYGLIAIVSNTKEAIDFCNVYAPEHLEIQTRNANIIANKINNAGSIFLGKWTTKSAGDYATGSNHILPTGGNAKMYSALSIEDFGRLIPIQEVASKNALLKIKKTIETLSEIENLPAHKNSTSIRFTSKEKV